MSRIKTILGISTILGIPLGIKVLADKYIFHEDGYNNLGYNREGYNSKGYNKHRFDVN